MEKHVLDSPFIYSDPHAVYHKDVLECEQFSTVKGVHQLLRTTPFILSSLQMCLQLLAGGGYETEFWNNISESENEENVALDL